MAVEVARPSSKRGGLLPARQTAWTLLTGIDVRGAIAAAVGLKPRACSGALASICQRRAAIAT